MTAYEMLACQYERGYWDARCNRHADISACTTDEANAYRQGYSDAKRPMTGKD